MLIRIFDGETEAGDRIRRLIATMVNAIKPASAPLRMLPRPSPFIRDRHYYIYRHLEEKKRKRERERKKKEKKTTRRMLRRTQPTS